MKTIRTCALFALTLALGSVSNERMAPLNAYLITDKQGEIALARSAAPPTISLHATVLVLTPRGFETAEQGTNGFTCLVERSWTKAFDDPDFWNSKMRAPVCYNPAASQSVLPYTLFRTKLALAGEAKSQILGRLTAAIAAKQLPMLEAGSMAYMMSKDQYLSDSEPSHWYAHVMFYAPKGDSAGNGESWGADLHGSPVMFDAQNHVVPEPWAVFFVPVWRWSDGTPALHT